MKRIIISAVVFLFAATGCLQVETNVFVNKDGSGIIEEKVLIRKDVIDMMKQFVLAFDSTQTGDFNFFKEEDLISKAGSYGEGVSYLSSEKLLNDNFEGVKVRYSFNDISKINVNLISDDQLPSLSDEPGQKRENEILKFVLNKNASQTNLKIFLPNMEEDPNEENAVEEMNDSTFNENYEKTKELFSDMKMSLRIIPDGKINHTDADFVEDNQVVVIEMDFNSLIKNRELFRNLVNNKIKSLDEFRKAIKATDGVKIESKNSINISF